MALTGKVRNGVVVLDNGAKLSEGTRVRVEPVAKKPAATADGYDDLLKLAGTVRGLPSDLARNHDHYLHGRPKR